MREKKEKISHDNPFVNAYITLTLIRLLTSLMTTAIVINGRGPMMTKYTPHVSLTLSPPLSLQRYIVRFEEILTILLFFENENVFIGQLSIIFSKVSHK